MTFEIDPEVADYVEQGSDRGESAEVVTGDSPRAFPCPEVGCDFVAQSALQRGAHRRHVHGVEGTSAKAQREKAKKTGGSADKAPPSVTVNLGGAKKTGKDPELEAVEKRALQMMQGVAGMLLLVGAAEDAIDVNKGAPAVAKAVRDLAEYEEWLRKLAAGGELTGRAMAWVNLALVLCAMLVPILLRHGALPENMAAMLGNIFATADQLATDAQAA